jgi:hypothetical protein
VLVAFQLFDHPLTTIERALRLHPDKGGDPELFKEVTHAYAPMQLAEIFAPSDPICRYEVLSDPDMRRVYDTRGEAGLNEQGGMGGMDPQVHNQLSFSLPRYLLILFWTRICSVSSLVAVASAVAQAGSLVAGPPVVAPVRPRISSTASTSV